MEEESIRLTPTELYRLLISDCRYGYTRNNHLMPSAAYGEASSLLEKMLEADPRTAIHTAEQLCEECISDQLAANFYDGLDDEFGNRREAIRFIEKMVAFAHSAGDEGFMPYNRSLYEACVENGKRLRYGVFRLEGFDFERDRLSAETKKAPIASDLSFDDAAGRLISGVLGSDKATFNRIDVRSSDGRNRVAGEIYRIISPETHRGEVYAILLQDEGK